MIDLHVHTNMSDGSLSPAEVVRRSAEKGLQAIAITDHDTVAGIAEAQAEGFRGGVEVISGVEMSVQWNPGIVHILGFFIRPDDAGLLESLAYLGKGRQDRIPKILSKLVTAGASAEKWPENRRSSRQAVVTVWSRPWNESRKPSIFFGKGARHT
jgi:predicted metal-dependent phosphoesterase TrpH